jgi:hypothetical protein
MGGQNTGVTENSLHLLQADPRFNQMCRVTVTQAMGSNIFFKPQALTTLRIAA